MGEKEIRYEELSKGIKEFLKKRGINSQYDMDIFLSPSISKLKPSGEDTLNIAGTFYGYIRSGKRIFIWGDEDVDGITSTFLLLEGLKNINAKIDYYIPNRSKEGYGLNIPGIKRIKEMGGDVIITVDCGITSFEEAAYAKEIGINLIITDHHEPRNHLPDAPIVNPKVNDVGYRYLAGVGVAFKFFLSIVKKTFNLNPEETVKTFPDILIYSMIGTITDRVPRLSENRILIVEGERYLHQSRRPSFKVLAENSAVDIEEGLRPLQAGREDLTKKFFLSESYNEAKEIYTLLRQRSYDYLSRVEEVFEPVKRALTKGRYAVFVPGLPQEFVGSCATRGRDITGMPVFVLTDVDGYVVGEGRGPDDFNLLTVLDRAKDLLISYGGHKPACGLKMERKNLDKFISIASEIISTYKPSPRYDSLLSPGELNETLIELLKMMEPFGKGNEEPVFLLENVNIEIVNGTIKIDGAELSIGYLTVPPTSSGRYNLYILCNGRGCNLTGWRKID